MRRRWHAAFVAVTLALGVAVAVPVVLSANHAAEAKADASPGPRDVIVHLFEWPWASVASECTNVLGPKGFGAVQVSPPQEHVVLSGQGYPWWQDYQPVSYRWCPAAATGPRSVDGVDLPRAGVKIYVDAVINHMAGGGSTGAGSNGSSYTPLLLSRRALRQRRLPPLWTQRQRRHHVLDRPLGGAEL
jgi:alpha-amylase